MARRNVSGTVADPTVQFVKVTLNDQEWSLCYDFNAIAEAERLTGLNLLQGIAGVLLHTFTALQFRALLYAALLKAHPNTTILDAGALLTIDSMPIIRRALMDAYGVAMPEEKKEDPPEASVAAES